MKVVKADSVTIIYPFLKQDSEFAFSSSDSLIVYPGGSIKRVLLDAPAMNAEAARLLAKALLHAADEAEKGQKG